MTASGASGVPARALARVPYLLADGTPVPGVTTVLRVLDKPALVAWANRLGLQGIDSRLYVNHLAVVGKIAHALILQRLTGEPHPLDQYAADEIERAKVPLAKFDDWRSKHRVEPILCEARLVSERHGYGGTVDFYGSVDGEPTLIDFKTGKGIYDEFWQQLAAYRALLEENGHAVESVRVLQIGRDDGEGFSEAALSAGGDGDALGLHFAIFRSCLGIYRARERLRRRPVPTFAR